MMELSVASKPTIKGLVIVDMADPDYFKPGEWFETEISEKPYAFLAGPAVRCWGYLAVLKNQKFVLRIGDPDKMQEIRSGSAGLAPIDDELWRSIENGDCPHIHRGDVGKALLALPGSRYWDVDWYKKSSPRG